jgi:hypothetical protein
VLYKVHEPHDDWVTLLPRDSTDTVSGQIHIKLTLDKVSIN